MSAKKLTCIPTRKSTIYSSKSKHIPNISLISPELLAVSSESSLKLDEQINYIRDFGLIKIDKEPCPVLSCGNNPRNYNTRICIGDFLGSRKSQKIIRIKRLQPLKREIKKRIFLQETMERSDLFRPASPNMMDQNVKLRMALSKSRRDIRVREKKRKTCYSLSPYDNGIQDLSLSTN